MARAPNWRVVTGVPLSSIGNYLAGRSEPDRDRAQIFAAAGGVRVEWLLFGSEPMTEVDTKVEQSRGAYRAVDLKLLAAVILAVEERAPLITPEAKAQLIAAGYEYWMAKGTDNVNVLREFLDLVAPSKVAEREAYRLPEPIGEFAEKRHRARRKDVR